MNYWEGNNLSHVRIDGELHFYIKNAIREITWERYIPWINIDRRPAHELYDIVG
jgi:hypothetical protein